LFILYIYIGARLFKFGVGLQVDRAVSFNMVWDLGNAAIRASGAFTRNLMVRLSTGFIHVFDALEATDAFTGSIYIYIVLDLYILQDGAKAFRGSIHLAFWPCRRERSKIRAPPPGRCCLFVSWRSR
jgi:hypothetical protein